MKPVFHRPVLWLAFAVAFAFGAIGQKTHFCTMGRCPTSEHGRLEPHADVAAGHRRRHPGAGALHAAGLIDLGKSFYRTPAFTWLSYLVGGGCSASAWSSPPVAARRR